MERMEQKIRVIRIVLAILAAFFIVLHGRWRQILEALSSPAFYIAVVISFVIAYFILWIIHAGNRMLNRRMPWKRSLYKRALLQVVVCVIPPAAADVLLAGIFIEATGRDFWASGFMGYDFPVVLVFILGVNSVYAIVPYLYGHWQKHQPFPANLPAADCMLSIDHNGTYVSLYVCQDVLAFVKHGRYVQVWCTQGTTYTLNQLLGNLEDQYAAHHFLRINPSVIVNLACVEGFQSGHKAYTLHLIFKPEYAHHAQPGKEQLYTVTKAYRSALKAAVQNR